MRNTVEKTVLNIALAGYDLAPVVKAMQDAKEASRVFGVMYGNTYDIAKRQDVATGEQRVGFSGQFEFVPADDALDINASDLLFLPKPLHDMIHAPLDKALYPPVIKDGKPVANDRKRKAKASIVFAYRATITLADNDAGFKWDFNFLVEPAMSDPFAALKEKVLQKAGEKAIQDTAKATVPETPKQEAPRKRA